MKYDFDRVIERTKTNSLKHDFKEERGKNQDVLPLWVADMDFQTAPVILDRLENAVRHGIFGYSETKDDYFKAIESWFQYGFGWTLNKDWLVKTPGVVFAIATAIRAYTREGESVLIQQPVYYPFREVIEDNNRKLVNSPLKLDNGYYQIDFEDFENKILEHDVKLFILCSPHNPVGRVWKKWELEKIGEICLKHHVIIVSNEIHSDFVYPEYKHIVFASLSQELSEITITCTSPSKTFNLAGLQVSNIFISNQVLRDKFQRAVAGSGYDQINLIGLIACQSAYEDGKEWLQQLKEYLKDNLTLVREFLKENLPNIKLIEPEGTYLVWLDFRSLNLLEEERQNLIENEAKLWLDSGIMFGEEGRGFERINIACPRTVLKQALEQLKVTFIQ